MEWERIAEDDETKGDEWEEDSYGNPFRLPPADVIRSTYQTKHIDYGSAHPSVEGKKRSLCLAPPFPLLWLLLGSIALVRFGAPTATKPVMRAPEQKKHHSSSSEPPYATVELAPMEGYDGPLAQLKSALRVAEGVLLDGMLSNAHGEGQIHIHAGTSCDDPGEHLYSTQNDPWVDGTIQCHWTAENGHAAIHVAAPFLTLQDAVGHAVVVHDAIGAKAACGVIEIQSRRLGGATPAPTENYYYEPSKRERHQERRRLYFFGWIALGLAGAAVLVVCLLNLGKLLRRDPSKPSKPVTEAEPLMRGATEYEACAAVPARRMNSEEMLAEEEAFVSENRASPTLFTL
jgi:hypothetical protein